VIDLRDELAALDLPATAQAALADFAGLFLKWNQRINLSAARSEPELRDHIVDCLHLVPHLLALAPPPPARFLDVGSGGGLPAAIAAICMPDAHITALEPVHKKHAFLRTAQRQLALANFEPLAQRLEDHPHSNYDAATSRATFDLLDWLRLGLTRVIPGGTVFGFEALSRPDLPPDAHRHPYALLGKSRAIISLRRPC
jgi:16S rRNA (guanine527-N7)-methyltransferase